MTGEELTAAAPLHGSDEPADSSSARRSANIAIFQGFLGSLLLFLGSISLGWLATTSSSLIRTPLFILARTSATSVIVCTVMLCVGALLMVLAWIRLAQRLGSWDAHTRPVLLKALAFWVTPMMFALPLFSRDAYAYVGQGRLMLQGLDPYTNGISALSNYFSLGPDTLWTEAPTPYGPLFLWIEQFAVWMGNGSAEVSLIPFRLASLAGVILLAIFVPRLAKIYGVNPNRAMWLVVLNPMVLINFIGSAHNDSLMLGLVVVGVYLTSRKHPVWGIVFVTASIAIKPITLIALPFVGLIWAGSQAGWGKKFGYWAATLAISMGLMSVAGVINGLGFGWLAALQTPGSVWIWYAPVGLTSQAIGFITSFVGGPGKGVTSVIQTIGQVVSIVLVAYLALRKIRPYESSPGSVRDAPEPGAAFVYDAAVARRMAWAFAAVVLLSPMIQPWYMIWLLVFFAVIGIKDGWQLRVVFFLTVFFILIALTDQLSVFQWISLGLVRAIAIVLGLALASYVMFFDKKTLLVFIKPRKPKESKKTKKSMAAS